MISQKHYINNSEVQPPKNWPDLSVELNYGKDQFPNGNTITITDFEWVRENYDLLMDYINDGTTNGVGIMEGVPYRIDVTDGSQTITIFSGYISLVDAQIKDKIKITAKAVSHATVDWINDVASGFTFEYLASLPTGALGAIGNDLYKFIPYTNSKVPNYEQAAIASIMVYVVSQQISDVLNEIADLTTDLANPFTAPNAIIKAVIKIAYLIVLLATLIKLIQDVFKFIISPVKYHAGMYVRDLFSKACEYLNMKFVSDIWDSSSPYYNEFILPEKLYNAPSATDSDILGFLEPDQNEQLGYYKGTFAQLIEAMKIKYNAKIVVSVPAGGATPSNQGTVYLIRKDKNAQPPQYKLPDVYSPEYTFNADEMPANYLIEFTTDSSDSNTHQDYAGTIYQVICQPKLVNYRPFVNMKNLVENKIPFARASKKTELTTPEVIIQAFLEVFDAIANGLISVVNGLIDIANAITDSINNIIDALSFIGIDLDFNIPSIPSMSYVHLSTSIGNRIGMLQLSDDHFSIAKIFILEEATDPKYNKIATDNEYYESAKVHWELFHYVNSFLPASLNPAYSDRPTGNQYVVKNLTNIPFSWSDFVKVFSNNRIFDANGSTAIIESLKFNPYKGGGVADMRVRFQQIYTLNLEETFLNPTGA